MKKSLWIPAVLILLSIAACAFMLLSSPASQIVEVVQDGKVIVRVDLAQETKRREITVKSPDGGYNTLLFEKGTVRIISADCPGHDCIRMGILRSASLPIVCLPHRLTIRFAPESAPSLDGVAR